MFGYGAARTRHLVGVVPFDKGSLYRAAFLSNSR